MKFFVAFVALVPFVCAAPVVDRSLATRQSTTVNVCVDATTNGASGTACSTLSSTLGQCNALPSDFDNDISSFIPDGGLSCLIFVQPDCTGRSFGLITSPGIPDLNVIGFNDVISSFT
ncbi:hypothetical protein B0H19DRAFT_1248797 [Mycena capillaripes]|nr:hypothetical protein B0H19DRAFT_1248797 [Mycena capillaripes]